MSETNMENIKPFAVVALLEDKPEYGLRRGQVGTVVEPLAPRSKVVLSKAQLNMLSGQ